MWNDIKIVFIDVDGTLTDGIYQISNEGDITKSFHTRDFYGIEQLMRSGIKVFIISQSHDNVIYAQLHRIWQHSNFWNKCCGEQRFSIHIKIDDKKRYVEKILKENKLSWDNVAYIGDAENDLGCIELAAFSGCPTDAIPEVREKALYPSDCFGGKGAVHDFCMHIIEKRNKEKNDENA